jgi:hypothetical protein
MVFIVLLFFCMNLMGCQLPLPNIKAIGVPLPFGNQHGKPIGCQIPLRHRLLEILILEISLFPMEKPQPVPEL